MGVFLRRHRLLRTGVAGAGGASYQVIIDWQNEQNTAIHAGGLEIASWLSSGQLSGADTTGRTFIEPAYAIRQNGYITSAKVKTRTRVDANQTWSFRLYRLNGSNYDYVAKQDFTPGIDGTVNNITFNPPILAQIGDIPGIYLSPGASNTLFYTLMTARNPPGRYVNADVLTSDAFTLALDPTLHAAFEFYGYAPYLAVTGDSIPEGHNTAAGTQNHGGLHTDSGKATQPWFSAQAEIMAQLRAQIGNGTILKYQNLALGSQTFAWVLSTGIVQALAVKPNSVLIHCGVNDVANARTWAAVEADLNAIKALVAAASPAPALLIDEILPWTAGSDAQAVTIRTWNANLATWCAANGATLVLCHDAMGQARVSTGELDDLITAYDADGVHLTATGVTALATIWETVLL